MLTRLADKRNELAWTLQTKNKNKTKQNNKTYGMVMECRTGSIFVVFLIWFADTWLLKPRGISNRSC